MSATSSTGRVRVERLEGGALRRLVLDAPKANVIDAAMTGALREAVTEIGADPAVKAAVIEGAGGHFSFGASVEEHLPGAVPAMLRGFHGLFRTMLDVPVVWLAAVRGRCLGGGMELASFCHRVFAAPDVAMGQPEIALGVFAPMASVFLAERVGRPAAEDLCLTGRTVGAPEALAIHLVDQVAQDPSEAALAWARAHLAARSAASLRHAVRAVRAGLRHRLEADLAEVECLYLDGLMATADAEEGLRAFLEKRPPRWRNA